MSEFKKIDDVLSYVKEGLKSGRFVPRKAEKFARIIARRGNVGEEVISWSVNSEGKEIEEKRDTVKYDPETGNPGWVATKADSDGNPIIDNNGHTNDWIIEDSTFVKKYEVESSSVYRPTGGTQIFVQLYEDVCLAQWGGHENVSAGGWINITNLDDIYGISRRDFEDTYRFVDGDSIGSAKIKIKK